MKTRILSLLFAVSLLLPVVGTQSGCKTSQPITPITLAYQTLGSVGAAVDTATKIVAAAQVKGTITAAQGAQYGVLHDKFNNSYTLACALAGVAVDSNSSLPAPADVVALYGDIQKMLTDFKLIP